MTKAATKGKPPQGAEERRSKRTEIVSTFSLYITVPKKGPYRLPVYDLSDGGIGFDIDLEEESGQFTYDVKAGDEFELQLYLNQSLYLPLTVVARRVAEAKPGVRKVGAEILNKVGPGHMALLAFLDMLDAVSEAGVLI